MLVKYPQESILEFVGNYALSFAGLIITTAAAKALGGPDGMAWFIGLCAFIGLRLSLSFVSRRQQDILALLQEKDASPRSSGEGSS
jgi:hypothetical protein